MFVLNLRIQLKTYHLKWWFDNFCLIIGTVDGSFLDQKGLVCVTLCSFCRLDIPCASNIELNFVAYFISVCFLGHVRRCYVHFKCALSELSFMGQLVFIMCFPDRGRYLCEMIQAIKRIATVSDCGPLITYPAILRLLSRKSFYELVLITIDYSCRGPYSVTAAIKMVLCVVVSCLLYTSPSPRDRG